jgi:hypothetical protein
MDLLKENMQSQIDLKQRKYYSKRKIIFGISPIAIQIP